MSPVHRSQRLEDARRQDLREILSGDYRIIYTRVELPNILVLTVYHGSRLLI